jgi:N-acetylneuraminate epimerase
VTWRDLPDLPPATAGQVQEGLAGAYTGHSGGALLLAGGTNFPGSTAQFARGALYAHEGLTKTWHGTVYALRGGRWTVAGQLPQAQGHGVSVQYGDELLLIGGETTGGAASAKVLSLRLQDGQLQTTD